MMITFPLFFATPCSIQHTSLNPIRPPATCTRRPRRTTPPTLFAKAKSGLKFAPTISNRQAAFRYELLQHYECGVELKGTEVKSIREGRVNLRDSYARVKDGQLFLHNVHISPWSQSHAAYNHEALRVRRLLLHKRDILRLGSKVAEQSFTLIATKMYFADNGFLKVEIALARGKNVRDKREVVKRRDGERDLRRIVKLTVQR